LGGLGIYYKDVIIVLAANAPFCLKADIVTKIYFIDKQLRPFEYNNGEKKIQVSYYLASEVV